MRLPTIADLPYGKEEKPPVRLQFVEVACKGSQARLVGRSALEPKLDLGDFTFRAVVDWVDIRVTLKQVTQVQWVQQVLREFIPRDSWIYSVNAGEGGQSEIFDIRIQEPTSMAEVFSICEALSVRFGNGAVPTITSLEISVDAYPKLPSDQKRSQLLGVMERTIFTSRDITTNSPDRPRTSIGKASKTRKLIPEALIKNIRYSSLLKLPRFSAPWIDGTFYIGAKENDLMIRIMDKKLDPQNPKAETRVVLGDTEKRVRIEAALRQRELADLGIVLVDDIRNFSFGTFQGKYFQFKLSSFATKNTRGTSGGSAALTLDQGRAEVFLIAGIYGVERLDRAHEVFRTMKSKKVQAYIKARGSKARKNRQGQGITGTLVARSLARAENLNLKHTQIPTRFV